MITLTVGTNSWVTVIEADSYMESKWGASAWALLTADQKKQALITAFNWIQSSYDYSVSPASTAAKVKNAQLEAAWYIENNWAEHEKRAAIYAQGVRDFTVSKFRESLKEPDLPKIVKDLLAGFATNSGGKFFTVTRTLED